MNNILNAVGEDAAGFNTHTVNVRRGYEDLIDVLVLALDQAQNGKGHARHGCALSFSEQPIMKLCDLYGRGFALGQAGKKLQESQRMDKDAATREMLGAIVYIAGAIIHLGKDHA